MSSGLPESYGHQGFVILFLDGWRRYLPTLISNGLSQGLGPMLPDLPPPILAISLLFPFGDVIKGPQHRLWGIPACERHSLDAHSSGYGQFPYLCCTWLRKALSCLEKIEKEFHGSCQKGTSLPTKMNLMHSCMGGKAAGRGWLLANRR